MYNFRNLFKKIPYDFLKFNFSQFTPQIKLFFTEKGHSAFSDSELRWKAESEKFSLSKDFKLYLKFSGK